MSDHAAFLGKEDEGSGSWDHDVFRGRDEPEKVAVLVLSAVAFNDRRKVDRRVCLVTFSVHAGEA